EYDLAAIRALKRCLKLQPENLTALMALSVCYTNERMEPQACNSLKQWMLNNPKYNYLFCNDEQTAEQEKKATSESNIAQFAPVKEMFITAARLYPYEPEPDVQCGLGVRFNIRGEFKKAIDCFR